MTDRVATTGTVWLGLTVGCAQCHTHKFDPITHSEYYRLFAFLNNADEPELAVPSAEHAAKRTEIEGEDSRELEAALPKKAAVAENARRRSTRGWPPSARTRDGVDRRASGEDGRRTCRLDRSSRTARSSLAATRPSATSTRSRFDDLPADITAIRLEALPDERLPAGGPGRIYYEGPKGDFFLSEMTLSVGRQAGAVLVGHRGAARRMAGPRSGHRRRPADRLGAVNGRPGASTRSSISAKPLIARNATLELLFERYYAASLGRFRVSVAAATAAGAGARPAGGGRGRCSSCRPKIGPMPSSEALLRHWLDTAPEFKAERDEIEALRKQLPALPTTLVMQERPADHPRPTHPPPPRRVPPADGEGRARRARRAAAAAEGRAARTGSTFARWLVSPENPLDGRVTVNRQWQAFFGRGIVRTTEDFGFQGEAADAPGAARLAGASSSSSARWSMKKLHRLIVTSATYRQSSQRDAGAARAGPENKLLARGPRVRLEAELVRDSALKAAGCSRRRWAARASSRRSRRASRPRGPTASSPWKVSERRGPLPPRPVHVRQADRAVRDVRHLRRPERRGVRRAPRGVEHAAAGADAAQRRGAARGGAGAGASGRSNTTGTTEDRVALPVPALPGAPPERGRVGAARAVLRGAARAVRRRSGRGAAAVAGPGAGPAAERAAWTATARAVLNLDESVTKE